MTRPCMSTSGPPELPGLIAASVWIAKNWVSPSSGLTGRSRALMMPWVTVPARPSGAPIAMTSSPTIASSEFPNSRGSTSLGSSSSRTARSELGSEPTTSAPVLLPSL